eukprot:9476023-Pyramimonas_sp.AAC.1
MVVPWTARMPVPWPPGCCAGRANAVAGAGWALIVWCRCCWRFTPACDRARSTRTRRRSWRR